MRLFLEVELVKVIYPRAVSYTHLDVYKRQLLLQEYHINWEYIRGKKNTAADILSHINIQQQTFEGEKELLVKVYNISKDRTDLEKITLEISKQQNVDPKIVNIRERILKEEEPIVQYYSCLLYTSRCV